MKKLYTLLAFISIGYSSFGQVIPAGTMAPPLYTTSTPTLYTLPDSTRSLFGTDSQFPSLTRMAQHFEFGVTDDFYVQGFIVWIGHLKVNGAPGTVSFYMVDNCDFIGLLYVPGFDIDGTSAVVNVSTSSLLSTRYLDNASVIYFPTPVHVNSSTVGCSQLKFDIVMDMTTIGDDEIGLFSTDATHGGTAVQDNYKLSWQYDNTFGSLAPWMSIYDATGGTINADMMIFPILDSVAFNAGAPTNVVAVTGGPPPTPTMTVTSPNGGESWTALTAHNITWNSYAASSNVKLEYFNGTAYTLIIASTPNDGTYSWTVPNTPTASCRVRVTDAVTTTLKDISNAVFTIAAPTGINESSATGADFNIYPNPANQKATISLNLAERSDVSISFSNVIGEKVKTLGTQKVDAGKYTEVINIQDLPKGIYIVNLTINDVTQKSKLIIE